MGTSRTKKAYVNKPYHVDLNLENPQSWKKFDIRQFALPSVQNLSALRLTSDLAMNRKIETSIEKYIAKRIIEKRKSSKLVTYIDAPLAKYLGLLLASQEQSATFGSLTRK